MHWPFGAKRKLTDDTSCADKRQLLADIRLAQLTWQNAQARLDWVAEPEEVDYAIFALAAAEKKYDMLLRQAKKMHWCGRPFALPVIRVKEGS